MALRLDDVPFSLRQAARDKARAEAGPTGYEGTHGFHDGYVYAPEHRRCRATKRDGNPCPSWTVAGSQYCRVHGGRRACYIARALRAGAAHSEALAGRHTPETVRMFYRQYLSKTLSDKLAECLSHDESEQTALLEDLALMRQTVVDIAQLYDVAHVAYEDAQTKEIRDKALEMKVTAGQLLRDAIGEVADIADKVEKHRAIRMEQTGVSVHAIAYIAKQCAQLAYRLCGDDLMLAQEFEKGIRAIRLPNSPAELAGTLITPDQDVLAMDDTVPAEEPRDG